LREVVAVLALIAPVYAFCQAPAEEPAPASPLARRYVEGEVIGYEMRATNQSRTRTLKYSARADGVVRKDTEVGFYEEIAWSALVVDGESIELPQTSRIFRERVSLSPQSVLRIPNLSQLHPNLIGPVLDLLNIYADLSLAIRLPGLAKAGDHITFGHNRPNSWADGRVILVGEDAIDFDITLRELDRAGKTATIVVRHVPPESPAIQITADWMKKPVAGTANNWTQVGAYPPGKYTAQIGSEVIDVRIVVDLANGRILSATIDNPVEVLERECEDVDAKRCGEPARYRILRTIELVPVRENP
jgi:hypothetical protein